jgi:beta-lactamase class C
MLGDLLPGRSVLTGPGGVRIRHSKQTSVVMKKACASRFAVPPFTSLPTPIIAALATAAVLLAPAASANEASARDQSRIERAVNAAIQPLMAENNIPGMAVAVTVRGQQYVFQYGLASKENGQKVTPDTIFEIGSISKTFTATLAAYAQAKGKITLSDKAATYLPALAGSSFDAISLLDLGIYTAGGLPLQFPDSVTNQETMVSYFKSWRPAYAAGTHRLYSNPSIGLLGHLAANSMGEPFEDLMEKKIFPAFGLTRTYLRVPQERMKDYAWGYSKTDKPVRVNPDVLASEAYGVKTTAADLIRFVEANMHPEKLDKDFRHAIAVTQSGYAKAGEMTQGLGWEMVAYPTTLDRLLKGNSAKMLFEANPVNKILPPSPPQSDVLVNKTGSTNGFSAYVAFVPARSIGIVILANRNYPIPARVKAAHQILTALDGKLD